MEMELEEEYKQKTGAIMGRKKLDRDLKEMAGQVYMAPGNFTNPSTCSTISTIQCCL